MGHGDGKEHGRRPEGGAAGPHHAPADSSTPGKNTLIERIDQGGRNGPYKGRSGFGRFITEQKEPAGSEDGEARRIAAEGSADANAPLPHLDKIQRSFGRHDVSHVRAAQDGTAGEATDALGAEAFAFGDRVAFGGAPSLHTAAHEAAHIVQQKAGVQLAGGVGSEGDAYERHADAVADRVVAGESAESLLDAMAGTGGGAAAQPALQLVTKIKPPDRRVGQPLEQLTLEEVKALISQLEGSALIYYKIDYDGETKGALLARAKKQRAKLESETKATFNVRSRGTDMHGVVLSDIPEVLAAASNSGLHVAAAANQSTVLATFGNSIAQSHGGQAKDTDPDAWKLIFEQQQDGLKTLAYGKPSKEIRGPRENAAELKADKKVEFKRPTKDPWVRRFEIGGACKRGKETPGRDAAMGGLNACQYAQMAKLQDADKHSWEWLHLIAASIGGNNEEGNLVAGTVDSNTLMIPFEQKVVAYAKENATPFDPVIYTVTAQLWEKTWVAVNLHLKAEHKNKVLAEFSVPALQISTLTKFEYDYYAAIFKAMFPKG